MEQVDFLEEIEEVFPQISSELKNFLNDYLKSEEETEDPKAELQGLESFVKLYEQKTGSTYLPAEKQNELRKKAGEELEKQAVAKEFYETALAYAAFRKQADAEVFVKDIAAAYNSYEQGLTDKIFSDFSKPVKAAENINGASPELQNYLKGKSEKAGKIQ